MRIVLLESLGVSDGVIAKHAQKLENMGHSFTAYEKNTDPAVQVERCRNADAVMLANMPLAEAVIDKAEHLKFIDVAFTELRSAMLPVMRLRRWLSSVSAL